MSHIKFVEALGISKVTKTLTFSNDTGTVNLFTVTGDVIVRIIAVCTTNVASGADGYIEMGISADVDAIIASTQATEIDAREIWNDSVSSREIEVVDSVRGYIITDGNDIILTLSAQVDSGVIAFYCFWTPLSSDGKVVAA